jgi:hypothetical protein
MKKQALNALLSLICLTATSAQSVIVYSRGPASQPPPLYIPLSQNVDLDRDGVDDFVFPVGPMIITMDVPTSFSDMPFYVGAAGTNEFLVSGYYASVQSFGALVGGEPPPGAAWSTPAFSALLTDQWWSLYGNDIGGQLVHFGWGGPLGVSGVGYLGVRFYQTDGLHYGWIRVLLNLPVVVDWAYETRPNKPIRAGDIDSTRDSVQFTVEFLTPQPRPRHPAQVVGTGSLILTGNTLRGELSLAGQFSSAQILDPNHRRAADRLVSDFGQPLVSTADHTAFFHDATLTRLQVNQLLHGAYYVSIDHGALAARTLPAPPGHHDREDRR